MKAKFQFRLPGVVRCTTSVYFDTRKNEYRMKLLNYRDRTAPRIPFAGLPKAEGGAIFFSKEFGIDDSFVIAKDWRGGIYTSGRSGEALLFGLTQLEEWSKPKVDLGNFYKVLTGHEMVVVRSKDRATAMAWATVHRPGAYVGPASWTDVELFKAYCGVGDIETVSGP